MTPWTNLQKMAAIAIGSGTGIGIFLYTNRKDTTTVFNSWTTNTIVPAEAKWDFNWDQ